MKIQTRRFNGEQLTGFADLKICVEVRAMNTE